MHTVILYILTVTWRCALVIGKIAGTLRKHWLTTLIISLGIYNLVTGIVYLPFAESISNILGFLSRSIVVFSGLSSFLLGFLLTLIGFGIYRRLKVAWGITSVLLIVSILFNLLAWNFLGVFLSGAILWYLYSKKDEFRASLKISIRYLAAIWILAFILLYGTTGFLLIGDQFQPNISTPIQALYHTVVTVSTVGYGDFLPVTESARVFTVSTILLGVGGFFSIIILLISPFIKWFETITTRVKKVTSKVQKHESRSRKRR